MSIYIKKMNITEALDLLSIEPKSFHILGKGAQCLALVHKHMPDCVLLLEASKKAPTSISDMINPQHARAVSFARQNDGILAQSMADYRNVLGTPYVHPSLIEESAVRRDENGIHIHIGKGKVFTGYSARLIKRIDGKALDSIDFAKPQNLFSSWNVEKLAQDIAAWMYLLHHSVSPSIMYKNKVFKQFEDAGKSITTRATTSEKFKIHVTQNVIEITKLYNGLKDGSIHSTFAQKIDTNLEDAGVNLDLLYKTATLLERRLLDTLPQSRIGMTHSDLHPGNIIANDGRTAVNGVCDWACAGVDAQAVDFAGLGLAKGLLPKVLKYYTKREKDNGVAHPINPECAYAYAAMRNIYMVIKAVKNGFGNGSTARIAWGQVGECMAELSRLNPSYYRRLATLHKHQKLPPIRFDAEHALYSRPHNSL